MPVVAVAHDLHLVIGAAGYLGSQLVRQLREAGLPVRVLVRDAERFRAIIPDGDVQVLAGPGGDADLMRRALAGVGVVYHCALDHGPRAHLANRSATRDLIDGCARQDAQLIFPDSAVVYGQPVRIPLGEDLPLRGRGGVLARLQRPLEVEIVAAARERGLRATRLRLVPVIGGTHQPLVGATFLRRLVAGRPLVEYGSGAHWVDYADRRDVACCMLLAAGNEAAYGRAFNVCGCGPIPRGAFLKLAADVAGVRLRTVQVPLEALRASARVHAAQQDLLPLVEGDFLLDPEAAGAVLGYRPQIGYADAVRAALATLGAGA